MRPIVRQFFAECIRLDYPHVTDQDIRGLNKRLADAGQEEATSDEILNGCAAVNMARAETGAEM
jgi:hypothetical protein